MTIIKSNRVEGGFIMCNEIGASIQDLQTGLTLSSGKATVFGKPLPDSMRCKALRRNCCCGHHFTREDDEKAGSRLMECPECGRLRLRCKKPNCFVFLITDPHNPRFFITLMTHWIDLIQKK